MNKKQSLLNVFISVFGKVGILLVSLFYTRFLIQEISNDANGLNNLFKSILGVLAVAELGVGTAISFSMYKPIVDNDIKKVGALYNLFKKVYLIVSAVILVAGLIVLPFIPKLAKDNTLDTNIYLSFFIYLLSVCLTYFYSAKTSLINAYKKNYVTSFFNAIALIIEGAVQIVILITTKNFIYFMLCRFISVVIQFVLTEIFTRKTFKEILLVKDKIDDETRKEVFKNTGAMFMHKIGNVLVNTVDSIIISSFIGVGSLGSYSNYVLIMTAMTGVLTLFFSPLTSTIGQMCVKEDKESQIKYLHFFLTFNFIIGVIFFLGYFAIIDDFVKIFFGAELELEVTVVIVIVVNYFIQFMRQACLLFRDATGTFYNDRFKPIIEGVVNIGLSILLVQFIGIHGVLIATIATNLLICHVIEPLILYKYHFKLKPFKYYAFTYGYMAVFVGLLFLTKLAHFSFENLYVEILVNGSIAVAIGLVVLGLNVAFDKVFRQYFISFFKKEKLNEAN